MSTITIAICARHAEHIIAKCLESIHAQTVAPDEVIVVVDDFSDPTASVASVYGVKVIESGSKGLYLARNAVLKACSTDYLGFIDADCQMGPLWIETAKEVLDNMPQVAAGTGPHPPIGRKTFASWLHHMWFIVETRKTGQTDGVIGGNSFFRVRALREVGGWLPLPGVSAAEDVYISLALQKVGYQIWFDERAKVFHQYENSMKKLWKKAVMMGRDIVFMLRAAGYRNALWWYTLLIPLMAMIVFFGGGLAALGQVKLGIGISAVPLFGSLFYLWVLFGSLRKTFPRWCARWILIWPYSIGVCIGIFSRFPEVKNFQSSFNNF